MNYLSVEILGYIAGLISTLAFFPQVLKVWKTNSTNDLSMAMYILYLISLILWSVYAWVIHAYSLLLTEVITALLVGYIIVKLINKN